MANFTRHQRGFTLIEMSIVLVIIGLIVGGILKGQELIESSRQKNFISQIDRMKAGTTTFIDRFKSVPGDFARITLLPNSGLLDGGDDNGIVGAVGADTAAVFTTVIAAATDETIQYFNHLQAAQLISGGAATSVVPVCYAGLCDTPSPLPASAFPQSGLNIRYGTHTGLTTPATTKQAHWISVSRFVNGAIGATQAVLSPERAFQLDNKYDDGVASTGAIRSGPSAKGSCSGMRSTSPPGTPSPIS